MNHVMLFSIKLFVVQLSVVLVRKEDSEFLVVSGP